MSNQEMTSAVQKDSIELRFSQTHTHSSHTRTHVCLYAYIVTAHTYVYTHVCVYAYTVYRLFTFKVLRSVLRQACILNIGFNLNLFLRLFVLIWTCVCGLVCWFSVGAGNQEGTVDPWRAGKKRGRRRKEEWLKKSSSNQRAGIGKIDNKGCKKDANSLRACLFADGIRWKDLTQGRKSCFSCV